MSETNDLLRILNERLGLIEQRLARIEDANVAIQKPRVGVPSVNIDDPKWGDPQVWRDPDQWFKDKKPSCKGKHYSQCTPEYLEELAKFNDYLGTKYETEGKKDTKGRPVAWRSRADAERARQWAARIRDNAAKGIPQPAIPMADAGYPKSFDDGEEPIDKDLF